MQFKLAETYRYWWPVTVRVPDPETPGRFVKQGFRVLFEPLDREAQLAEAEKSAALKTMRELVDHEIENALRVVRNWEGVVGDDGILPFSEEMLKRALRHSWFRDGLQQALKESLAGEEARLGN
ncbi:hypothetical protein [Paracoccus sp. (in: a-proteobacteria)]|uniref:hypothetical protein n=1 Tax=Paracoccus sp. TaxID=267 RepID=UPI00321FCAD6